MEPIRTVGPSGQKDGQSDVTKGMVRGPLSNIPNSQALKRVGVRSGAGNRLIRNSYRVGHGGLEISSSARRAAGGVLKVGRGARGEMKTSGDLYIVGDRMHGPSSEPTSNLRSKEGFKGKIVWDTPTTVAPIARAAFAGGGSDSVPTVTPISASQTRISSIMTKKRMLRNAGKHYGTPYNRPARGNRLAPNNRDVDSSGNIRGRHIDTGSSQIIAPPNQEDTNVTSRWPNPMEPLAPNDPVEQQGEQLKNFRGALRIPMESTNFPLLTKSRGLDRNLKGKGDEIGPFDTEAESDKIVSAVHGIIWN